MKRTLEVLVLGCLILIVNIKLDAQNVAVTDDNGYTANPSAMLDVKSTTKGMLVPRLTTSQRLAISAPATGLLVFDTSDNGFYYYNGSSWINITTGGSTGPFWSYSSPNIYMTTSTDNLGIGTSTPTGKLTIQGGGVNSLYFENGTNDAHIGISGYDLEIFSADDMKLKINEQNSVGSFEILDDYNSKSLFKIENNGDVGIGTNSPGRRLIVQADASTGINEAIFAVQNSAGDTVMAVYEEGVRIWVNDAGGTKASGSRGGFAVGGYNPAKAGFTNEYLRVTPDSVRVYINDDYVASKASGSRGGFAVGGFNPAKGSATDNYLFVQDDSTRVYVADSLEGFGVENIEAAYNQRIMRLTTDNYFIGHESGINITTGKYNTFIGYKTGIYNTSGNENVFLGYESGYSNLSGHGNVFIGDETGFSNTNGYWNVFLGQNAGKSNTLGDVNVFIGQNCAISNESGSGNICIGENAYREDTDGDENVFIGKRAGMEKHGNYNVMIGSEAGGANYLGTGPSVSNSIMIGRKSGFTSSGNYNLLLGIETEVEGDSCILIGHGIDAYDKFGNPQSNVLKIDDGGNNTHPLIFGSFHGDRVGINDGIPTANLHIKQKGSGEEGLAIENDGNTNTWSWEVGLANLNFAFNGTTVGYWDDATGNYTATSDKRLKKDISLIEEPVLNRIMKIKPVTYRLKHADSESQKAFGFIAQDLLPYFPEVVRTTEEGTYCLNYDDFGILSVKAIQEQQKIIEDQEERITELEKKLEILIKELKSKSK